MNPIDRILNYFTMYRVALYGLVILVVFALALSFIGILGDSPASLFILLFLVGSVSYVTNTLFARLFAAPTNVESIWITAFILFFTLAPVTSIQDAAWVSFGAFLAVASKYILAYKKKHVFNPAAFSLVVLTLTGSSVVTWWIATPAMVVPVAIIGLFIVRKIHRFDLWLSFVFASMAILLVHAYIDGESIKTTISEIIVSWPVLFFSTVMLTEPITMPPSRNLRIIYGLIVGLLFGSTFTSSVINMTPQLALCLGNIYAFGVSSKQKLLLTLAAKTQRASHIYEFLFNQNEPLDFKAGQYVEWTLPHTPVDSRGNRRYFTISTAPEHNEIGLGVRLEQEKGSSFKKALNEMQIGDTLSIGSLSGDFVLPKDPTQPLVFIAGGIGITPFISMLRHLMEVRERRSITLFYATRSENDIAYADVLTQAKQKLGITVVHVISEAITPELLVQYTSSVRKSHYYLSGPHAMVTTYKSLLRSLRIPRRNIKTDYFPGF